MFRTHCCVCVLCVALGLALAMALLFLTPNSAVAQQPATPVSFINDVAPILKENCFACHDARKRKGKLDMTKYESFRKGGDKDDPVVPGKADESYLMDVLTATDKSRMPPKEAGDALPKEKIALIERWIREGAKLDEGIAPSADLSRELRLRWKPPMPPAAYKYPVNINTLAFTPNSQKLVVGGYHELTVWDVATAVLEKRIRTRAERAYAMAFLPDGKLVVAGGRPGQEGDVRVYDLEAGTSRIDNGVTFLDSVNDKAVMIRQLLDADDSVLCLAVSADGKRLASGGCDRIVNVWDLSAGYVNAKLEQAIENHADWVFGVVFSPDGKHLLTCSRDKTAKVWDLASKESVLTFPDHQNPVYAVAVNAKGDTGFSVGEDNQLRVWRAIGDGKQVRATGGHGKPVFRLVHHPSQPLLVTCSADSTVRVWNEANGAAVRTLSGHSDWLYAVAISPDGNLIAAGGWAGEVRVWKVADGTLLKAFQASPGFQPPAKQ